MKRFLLVLAMVLLISSISFAPDVSSKWDAVTDATGYKIYKSEDMGATWATPVDVGNVTTYIYLAVIETKMVHFRVSAYNANGETVRSWSGAWYDHRLRPINSPPGAGIQ